MLDVTSRFKMTLQSQKTKFSEIYFQFFFQRTSILAKEVEITPPCLLKKGIHFAEIIKSSLLAVANLRFKTSGQAAAQMQYSLIIQKMKFPYA